MEYRTLSNGGGKIDVTGVGSSVVGEQSEKNIIETVRYAVENLKTDYIDLLQRGVVVIPKSVHKERIEELFHITVDRLMVFRTAMI